MATDLLGYDKLVEGAWRSVVRGALQQVVETGLPGNHHFYITFDTEAPDVDIADHLRIQYPHEMTIVLQHQFSGLSVAEDQFRVVLSFNKVPHELVIPFAAIKTFADPSVNFALQFGKDQDDADAPSTPAAAKPRTTRIEENGDLDGQDKSADDRAEKVVPLDAFRKK